jgi:hypothetical protein
MRSIGVSGWPAIVALTVAAGCLGGCASGGGRSPSGVAAAEAQFLLPPAEGWTGGMSPTRLAWLTDLHRDLLQGEDPDRVLTEVLAEVGASPEPGPELVLEAQARFVGGAYAVVLATLDPVRRAAPGYTAAQVLYGRAAERLDRPLEALAAYWTVRQSSPAAAARVGSLLDGSLDRLAERVEEGLAAGMTGEAQGAVELMQLYAPDDQRTLLAAQALAAAAGDPLAQLGRLRELTARPGADPELVRRRAELELEVGEPAFAVRLAEELAAADPSDPGYAELLQRARFEWRLDVLPPEVGRLGRGGELSRADYAVLLYWLFPGVRYGRSTEARIASDIIDHEEREQIVRVINLGLLEVDSVHRFEPDAPVRRTDALRALLLLVEGSGEGGTCLEAVGGLPRSSDGLCGAARACGIVSGPDECLPAGSLTGPEALELIRRTLAGLDAPA